MLASRHRIAADVEVLKLRAPYRPTHPRCGRGCTVDEQLRVNLSNPGTPSAVPYRDRKTLDTLLKQDNYSPMFDPNILCFEPEVMALLTSGAVSIPTMF